MIIIDQPEQAVTQPSGRQPPPAPPRRTAVGTDEPEKRPCQWCGHTQAEHMGPRCAGKVHRTTVDNQQVPMTGSGVQIPAGTLQPGSAINIGVYPCICPTYQPRRDR